MVDRSSQMALIGAGPVGLGMALHGISYEQLEADYNLGGNWYHGVYETVHIIFRGALDNQTP
jgi:cation diffusion facilitator CzcD-associated flavoprotein CzcO